MTSNVEKNGSGSNLPHEADALTNVCQEAVSIYCQAEIKNICKWLQLQESASYRVRSWQCTCQGAPGPCSCQHQRLGGHSPGRTSMAAQEF